MLLFKKWLYSLSSKRVATVIAGVIVAGLVMLGDRIGFELTEQAQAGLTMFVVNMIAAIWSDTNRSFHSSESITLGGKISSAFVDSKRMSLVVANFVLSLIVAFGEGAGIDLSPEAQAGLITVFTALIGLVWADTKRPLDG